MSAIKREKAKEAIMHAAADFVAQESNRTSLVTVTNIDVRNREKDIFVMVSVLPDTQQQAVVDFLNRRRGDMRDFLRKKVSLRVLPRFTFLIDQGEKNRQRIDELTYQEEERKEKNAKEE